MGVAKNFQFNIQPDPNGGYMSSLTCPAPGCGGNATIRSAKKDGTYRGSCDNGHFLKFKIPKVGPAPSS